MTTRSNSNQDEFGLDNEEELRRLRQRVNELEEERRVHPIVSSFYWNRWVNLDQLVISNCRWALFLLELGKFFIGLIGGFLSPNFLEDIPISDSLFGTLTYTIIHYLMIIWLYPYILAYCWEYYVKPLIRRVR
jgi:hypothetical protein